MADSYAVQLERVQAAIKRVLEKGESYEIATNGTSRRWSLSDLETLRDYERDLRLKVDAEAAGRRGGIRVTRGIAAW